MPVEGLDSTTEFIDFPSRDEIVSILRSVDDSSETLDELYTTIADRLASRTYERSASAFILIELMYDFEEASGGDMSYLLPRFVLSLTGDKDLALSALGAFNEIKDAIKIQGPAERGHVVEPEPVAASGPGEDRSPPTGEDRADEAEEEALDERTKPVETIPEAGPIDEDQDQAEPEVVLAEEDELAPARRETAPPAMSLEDLDRMMKKLQLAQKTLADLGLATRVSIDLTMRRPTRERVSRTLQEISSLRSAMRRFEELLSEAELQVLEAAGVLWGDSKGR